MRHRRSTLVALLLVAQSAWSTNGLPSDGADPVVLAQEQVAHYVAKLADLHCTETVMQQKLNAKGRVEATERSQFDYLLMMNGNSEEFQLNESRLELPESKHKTVPASMLITNGMTTVLLVFHPYYSDAFSFETGPEEMLAGKAAIPVHFAHITGRRTPAALALRNREFPLELKGTAWLDKQSGQVMQVNAGLERDMSDVGLRSLDIHVEYTLQALGKEMLTVPSRAVVDVTTPRQHWRNTHLFDNYKSFSTDAEQDPNYKVHPEKPASPEQDQEKPKEQQ